MKPFILLLLAIYLLPVERKSFSVKAHITGIPDSTKLMLQNLSRDEFIDSAIVVDGKFSFSGNLPGGEPEELRIISSVEDLNKGKLYYTDLLIANEEVSIEGDISQLPNNVTTTGSKSQAEAESYYKQLLQWSQKIQSYNASLATADSIEKIQLNPGLQKLKDSIEQWKINYIKQHFDQYIALLLYNYRKDFSADTLKALFAKTPPAMKKSKYGKAIEMQIKYPKPQVGRKVYDFEAMNADGKNADLPVTSGKYILLQFAGTGCYWSGLSIKNMKSIYPRYKDAVSFVSFFIDADKKSWLATTRHAEMTWPSLWTSGGKYGEVYNKYGITGTPTFFLIAPDKSVVSQWFGFEEGLIEKELNKFISSSR